jgi:hypothetical protein
MKKNEKQHPVALWLLKTLLLLLAPAAIIPGMELMLDPSGKSIQFPEGYLASSPFSDYFIPGLLLTFFVGFLSLVAWFALWKRPESDFLTRLNPVWKQYWGWTATLCCGLGLVIWIMVQMAMVPYFFLQLVMLIWGSLIIMLCFAPGVRAFYKINY